uniref:Uncharacterized protein n=1 Tax=Tanacetum cinerariifolium TaxID=118510 RepID=A0A6L2MH49_TANCI|nr:hypothetical protein [Tanacetum cinerariifolium]
MDLFSFIRHSDLTKVLIGERNVMDGEVKLLTMTKGRDVFLATPASAASGGSSDSIDICFDDGNDAEPEHPTVGDDDVLAETVAKDVSEKLREDYHAATSNTGGKSLATICSLILEGSSISCKVVEPHDDGLADSVFGLNLQTCPPSMRFPVTDASIMTVVVTTTVDVGVSIVLVSKDRIRSRNLENFRDSASADLDYETLPTIYVPKWKVTNDFVLDDPYILSINVEATRQICLGAEVRMRAEHTLEQKDRHEDKCAEQTVLLSEKDAKIAHLKSLLSLKEVEAIRLCGQLCNVEAADAAKSNELRDLKERNFTLEGEKDVLSEKVTTLEFVTALKETELASLTAQVAQLTSNLSGFQLSRDELSSKVASLESERDRLVNHRSSLESAFKLFKGCMEAMQDEKATLLGVDHEKARRDQSVIEAYDPSAESNTSVAPATAEPITTLSTTFASSGVVPPLFISDYQVLDPEPHDEDPPATTFEENELDIILESIVLCFASWIAACSLLSSKRSKLISKASSFFTNSTSAVNKVGMPISTGIIASIPYGLPGNVRLCQSPTCKMAMEILWGSSSAVGSLAWDSEPRNYYIPLSIFWRLRA